MYTVYTMPNCPDCKNAKDLLKRQGHEFEEKVAGQDFTREQLMELVGNVRTLPQITVQNQDGVFYVGGFKDLAKLLNGGGATIRKIAQ